MMGVALTAIFSFALGLLLAAAGAHWLMWKATHGRGALAFMGGIIRGLALEGFRCIAVRTIDGSVAHVDMLDLAVAVERAIEQMGPPPPPTDGAGDFAEEGV